MKITQYLAMAAVFVFMLFGISAFAGTPTNITNVVTPADNAASVDLQTAVSSQVSACRGVASELRANQTLVKESVGKPVLDVFSEPMPEALTLDGYSTVLIKPKISS